MKQQTQSGEERVMGEDRLHVVFGTGQVGSALAAHLAGQGIAVRAVSRHRPPALAALAGVDWQAADAADPEAAADAAKGASVIYQCLNAPYTQWPERFPPLQRGERVFGNALAGRRADFIGNLDLPHTYSYVPDIAAGLATLGTDPRAAGQVGHPVGIRPVPKLALRALGLVNPVLRELAETYYQFGQPFVLDTSKYQGAFGTAGTPLADAIAATLAWYRTRPSTP
jgi:nucleoside-diphosphate-sugar epimerase